MADPRIFISYRRKPSAMLATLLARELKPRGIDAFVDTRRTDGGGPFPDRLLRAIEAADVFVCLLGEDTLASDWVRREIEHAHAQDKILIPVFQEHYIPPAAPPEVGGAVHALLQSDGVHVMDVKNIYVDQAIDTLATMIVHSVPRRGPRRGLLAGLGTLAVLAVALILLILSDVLNPSAGSGIPDASQAARTLTAAAETATALVEGPTSTANVALFTQLAGSATPTEAAPGETLTSVAFTQVALDSVLTATSMMLGPTLTAERAAIPVTPTPSPFQGPSPTPLAVASNRDAALQRAAAFQGGNGDWTPYFEAFTFEPGVTLDLALVPPGCFPMGADPEAGEGAADGGQQCFDAPFWIGRTEVTNAQYLVCVEAGVCDPRPLESGPTLNGPDQPVLGVDWTMATQYTTWLRDINGMEFSPPSEAEWEYAARGPDGLAFPWGDEFDGNRLNFCDAQCDRAGRDDSVDDGFALTAPVGTYSPAGDSWVGAADLAGNAWEWVASVYWDYPYSMGDGRETTLNPGDLIAVRGGGWANEPVYTRAAYRGSREPEDVSNLQGFRVASLMDLGVRGQVIHFVRPGDTVSAIAVRYGVSVDALIAANATLDPDRLAVGQRLVIPAESSPSASSSSLPEASSLPDRDAVLQHAAAFEGGNDDWEPYIETFTFDNGVTIDLALVPGGCFEMGNDPEVYPHDGGEQCFDSFFWIGRNEVTNAQYMQCVDAGACDIPDDYGADFGSPDQPVVGVDWLQARQYVEWLSELSEAAFSLPTEAEWEYAARGPDGLVYPWGNVAPSCDLSNYFGCIGHPAPVGSYSPAGDSWVGVSELVGNVWEWTSSIYQAYPYDLQDGREDLANAISDRVARGVSWNVIHGLAQGAFRNGFSPGLRSDAWGFRVVGRLPAP